MPRVASRPSCRTKVSVGGAPPSSRHLSAGGEATAVVAAVSCLGARLAPLPSRTSPGAGAGPLRSRPGRGPDHLRSRSGQGRVGGRVGRVPPARARSDRRRTRPGMGGRPAGSARRERRPPTGRRAPDRHRRAIPAHVDRRHHRALEGGHARRERRRLRRAPVRRALRVHASRPRALRGAVRPRERNHFHPVCADHRGRLGAAGRALEHRAGQPRRRPSRRHVRAFCPAPTSTTCCSWTT